MDDKNPGVDVIIPLLLANLFVRRFAPVLPPLSYSAAGENTDSLAAAPADACLL